MIPDIIQRFYERKKNQHSPYAALFSPYTGDEVISLDCEATDINIKQAELLSIGAVRIRGSRVITSERLDIKLKPPASLSASSIKIHKIRAMDLTHGMDIEPALHALLAFIGNRPILGYYVDYDRRLLSKYLKVHLGFQLPNKTIELSRLYEQKMHKTSPSGIHDLRFETISKNLKIPTIQRHSALGDAITVAMMYVQLMHGSRLT